MKNFYALILFLLIGFSVHAQVNFEAPIDYGKLWNFVYDPITPNRLFALTYRSHIMVSNDNGATWEIFYAHPNSYVTLYELRLTPGRSSLSVIIENSTNEQDDGVFIINLETADVIQRFVAPNFSRKPFIRSYSILDDTYNNVLLHTTYTNQFTPITEIYYTTNQGSTWTPVYLSYRNNNVHVNKVAISPTSSSTLYITRGHGPDGILGGVFKSTDSGLTWSETLAGTVVGPIAFNPDNANEIIVGTGIAFGMHAEGLHRSTDGGNTWEEFTIEWSDGILNNIVDVSYNPYNSDHIWVLEENEIAISTNAGVTWSKQEFDVGSEDYYYGTNVTFNPFNANNVVIATDVFPMYSLDYGTTLQKLDNPLYYTHHVSISDNETSKHVYFGTQGGYFNKDLTSGVVSGYEIQSPREYIPNIWNVTEDETVPGRVFLLKAGSGLAQGELYYSNDHGATSTFILSGFIGEMQNVVKDPTHANVYWVSLRNNGSGWLYKIDIGNAAGPVATEVPVDDEGVVTGISISEASGNMLVAKGIKVFSSTDGGITWTEKITGLEVLDVSEDLIWDMVHNPFDKNELILATTQGLFKSTDRGETWSNVFNEFNSQKVSYSPKHNGLLVASAVPTAELAYSINNGLNWSTVSAEQLGYIWANDADFYFGEQADITVYFATPDLGIVSYTINDIVLGLPEMGADKISINVYPNPAVDQIAIEVDPSLGSISSVVIFDLNGKRSIEKTTSESVFTVAALKSGLYIVKVTTNTGFIGNQKFIKK